MTRLLNVTWAFYTHFYLFLPHNCRIPFPRLISRWPVQNSTIKQLSISLIRSRKKNITTLNTVMSLNLTRCHTSYLVIEAKLRIIRNPDTSLLGGMIRKLVYQFLRSYHYFYIWKSVLIFFLSQSFDRCALQSVFL